MTTLFQTMSHGNEPEGRDSLENQQSPGKRPFFIGGCHSWRTDGPVVAEMFPQFATKPAAQGLGCGLWHRGQCCGPIRRWAFSAHNRWW